MKVRKRGARTALNSLGAYASAMGAYAFGHGRARLGHGRVRLGGGRVRVRPGRVRVGTGSYNFPKHFYLIQQVQLSSNSLS